MLPPPDDSSNNKPADNTPLFRAETNLLRYPIFALATKGLRTRNATRCSGLRTVEGEKVQFSLVASRNTEFMYTGPFCRKVHFGLLRLLMDRPFPYENPLRFSWRGLAKAMDISYSGATTISRLKEAICSIHGLLITTQHAFVDGKSRMPLPYSQRGYYLYQSYGFTGDTLENGDITDVNFVSFSDWYLDNLNHCYFAPLKYDLWLKLEHRSRIASRCYEFLIFNCAGGQPVLRVNYETLCQFLPIEPQKHEAHARSVLATPLKIIRQFGILNRAEWTHGKNNQLQLVLYPGKELSNARAISDLPVLDHAGESQVLHVEEDHSRVSPAEELVRTFHRLRFDRDNVRPTATELKFAGEILEKHGRNVALDLMPLVVKIIKDPAKGWVDAKNFCGTRDYWPLAVEEREKLEQLAARKEEEHRREITEKQNRIAERRRRDELRQKWLALPEDTRESITHDVLAQHATKAHTVSMFKRYPDMLERYCLEEMERQSKKQ